MNSSDNLNLLDTPFGSYKLERIPKIQKGGLRAWDSADELLLQTIFTNHRILLNTPAPVLIINDGFGALSTALSSATCTTPSCTDIATTAIHSWSDSYLSHLATHNNVEANNLAANLVDIPSTDALAHNYSLVIIKIPKTLALLEDQLYRLKPHLNDDTLIIASAMSKHIHTSTLNLFEKIIGTTTTSRATKKARLIFSQNNNDCIKESPYPKTIHVPEYDLQLLNHANVFSQKNLDIGARFFIKHLKDCPSADHIIDLGCGNGVLGIMAQRLQQKAKLSFIDESYMAVASAKQSYSIDNNVVDTDDKTNNTKQKKADYIVSDCFNQYTGEKANLILCNPPFHQAHSMGDHIAWQMFKQSALQLHKNGELWVIGNRHLGYHGKLKKLFGNCRTITANKKFVILTARMS